MDKKEIKKRFPATIAMEKLTFLNDKKIDAELYAYLQSCSKVENGQTVVRYRDLPPTQKELYESIGIKSPKTYHKHLEYLEETKYIEKLPDGTGWVLPNQEDHFVFIPLETLQLMIDTFKDPVVKIYLYLGQKWKNKNCKKQFTYIELGEHTGIDVRGNARGYTTIRNILTVLQNNNLIKISAPYSISVNKTTCDLLDWGTNFIKLDEGKNTQKK